MRRHIKIVPANQKHVDSLKGKLRKVDDDECRAMNGISADEGMQRGFYRSDVCWTILMDDKPIGIFGVAGATRLSPIGVPWLLGTDDIRGIAKAFVKFSRVFVKKMVDRYETLVNYVDVRNEDAVRWLKWCGFKFEEPKAHGVENKLFYQFWITKELYYV